LRNSKTENSGRLYERASRYFAGGVGSHARGKQAGWDPYPLFIERGEGSRICDVDGNEYIDYVLALGPLIFGHKPGKVFEAVFQEVRERGSILGAPFETEYEVAKKLVELIPCFEMARFTSTGTEAIMAALRLARAYTGKTKVVRFEGHYHGWADGIHVRALTTKDENGEEIWGPPIGSPANSSSDLLILPWNNTEILSETLNKSGHEIAAVIMEPVMCNCGVILPGSGYLESVREITRQHDVLLIFDEIITGFRLGLGGAQGYFKVTPDLAVFGKALGAGFPISAYGGNGDIMRLTAEGKVPLGGTYNSNVMAMAAARVTLRMLEENSETIYSELFQKGERLRVGVSEVLRRHGIPAFASGLGPVMQVWFSEAEIREYRDAKKFCNAGLYRRFWEEMLSGGIYFHPAPFENWFLSTAHTIADINATIEKTEEAARTIRKEI
jgi:glutamate-1-semialdehyde 2,1-aminomutase